jgi:hypothetical protein
MRNTLAHAGITAPHTGARVCSHKNRSMVKGRRQALHAAETKAYQGLAAAIG